MIKLGIKYIRKGGIIVKCIRCNKEMEKRNVKPEIRLGYYAPRNGSQNPIEARALFICPKCGCMELNIRP